MSQKEELRSIIEFVTDQLDAKWAILITHDESGNVVAVHSANTISGRFVQRLEAKLFEGMDCCDIISTRTT